VLAREAIRRNGSADLESADALQRQHQVSAQAEGDLGGPLRKLRGCDLVKIKIGDLVSDGRVRNRAMVIQQKTKRPVHSKSWSRRDRQFGLGSSDAAAASTSSLFPAVSIGRTI
jgi:hypothetical protein